MWSCVTSEKGLEASVSRIGESCGRQGTLLKISAHHLVATVPCALTS